MEATDHSPGPAGSARTPIAGPAPNRPRLLFINGPWDHLGLRVRRGYVDPFDQLLRQDFDVISVPMPCDLGAEVERHHPDLIVLHTGIECGAEPHLIIRNVEAHREIPRIAFILRDPFTPSRGTALNRARRWLADGTIVTFRPSDSPFPIFNDAYYLPWWIDDSVYKDYQEPKNVTLSLTGAGWFDKELYCWRNSIFEGIKKTIPFLHAPSLNEKGSAGIPGTEYVGESYARLLNRSLFSAGCGSVNRYLTQKLFEIPGSGTCLVTERSQALEAIGMQDGVNCVFTDGAHVSDRLSELMAQPERLRAITQAGHRLIHEGHTQRERRLVVQWFELWRARRPGQRIVQTHPFKPLLLVDKDQEAPAWEFPTENPFAEFVRTGFSLLREGNTRKALEYFAETNLRTPWAAEPRLGCSVCMLRHRKIAEAIPYHIQHIAYTEKVTPGSALDPVDQAVTALMFLTSKDPKRAVSVLSVSADKRHPALNAMRWIAATRYPKFIPASPAFSAVEGDSSLNLESVHQVVPPTFGAWEAWLNAQMK